MDGGGEFGFYVGSTPADEAGCAFIVGDALAGATPRRTAPQTCGAARQPDSSYCPHHHAVCHHAAGGATEAQRLRETEMLAALVGGRYGREARVPPDAFLQRLERAVRLFSRPNCSRIVPNQEEK
jgi:hypothetical protein